MSILRHTSYNLLGVLLPTLLALITVPAYLHLIGPTHYGILAIAWVILGYFGVFDLGLGRATTQRIALLCDGSAEERATALHTALFANMAIGVIGAAILWLAAWYYFSFHMHLDEALKAETLAALPFLAMAVPVATSIGVLSGALMGREKFYLTNRIAMTSTALFQIFPLVLAWFFGPHIAMLLAASIAARLIGFFMYWQACRREFGKISLQKYDRKQLRILLSYGGWITLTAVFGPLLVTLDRFAIGALLGPVAVAIYTVPMQMTTRLGPIAGALGNALFPRLAVAAAEDAKKIMRDSVAVMLAVLTPLVVVAYVLMQDLLGLWVGPQMGDQAAPIGRVLLIAAWLNCFAQMPYVLLQSQGRPDIVTKILMVQLPFYLAALYFGLKYYHLLGAAAVYLLRVGADLALLGWASARRIDHWPQIALGLLAFAGIEVCLAWLPAGILVHMAWAMGLGFIAFVSLWRMIPPHIRKVMLDFRCRGMG